MLDLEIHMAVIYAIASLVVLAAAVISIWARGPWFTILIITVVLSLSYQPLFNASLFGNFKTDLTRRIIIGGIPLAVICLATSFCTIPWFVRVLIALVGPALMLTWVFAHFDVKTPRMDLFVHRIAPLCAAEFAVWLVCEWLASRSGAYAGGLVTTAVTAALAALLIWSTENQAGVLAPLISASAGGATAAAVIGAVLRKPIRLSGGPILLLLTVCTALLAFAWIDTDELPIRYLLIILVAPLLSLLLELPALHRIKPWKRELLRTAVVLVPVTIAVTLAYRQHKQEATESGDEYSQSVLPGNHAAAPICPSQMPIPNTIIPPTMT